MVAFFTFFFETEKYYQKRKGESDTYYMSVSPFYFYFLQMCDV